MDPSNREKGRLHFETLRNWKSVQCDAVTYLAIKCSLCGLCQLGQGFCLVSFEGLCFLLSVFMTHLPVKCFLPTVIILTCFVLCTLPSCIKALFLCPPVPACLNPLWWWSSNSSCSFWPFVYDPLCSRVFTRWFRFRSLYSPLYHVPPIAIVSSLTFPLCLSLFLSPVWACI